MFEIIGSKYICWISLSQYLCKAFNFLAKSWAPIQARIENTSTGEEPVPACCDNEQKAAVGVAADNVEDMTSSAADLETEETQTTVRRREVVSKSEMRNPPPDVSGAGDVGLVDAARPTAAVEPTVKDKHEWKAIVPICLQMSWCLEQWSIIYYARYSCLRPLSKSDLVTKLFCFVNFICLFLNNWGAKYNNLTWDCAWLIWNTDWFKNEPN